MEDGGRTEDILPNGELLRRAVLWISERRQQEPDTPWYRLIEEAGRRFDLTPLDEEFLTRNLPEA